MRNELLEYHYACVGISNEPVLESIMKRRTVCTHFSLLFQFLISITGPKIENERGFSVAKILSENRIYLFRVQMID